MKKAALVITVVALFAICAVPAFAGQQITLSDSGSNNDANKGNTPTLIFTSNGAGGFSLSIKAGTYGIATDSLQGFFEQGNYSIIQNGGTISGVFNSMTGLFDITQSPSSNITFYYGQNGTDGTDGGLLVGDLQLVSLQQTASSKSGVFNEALVVNLTNIATDCANLGDACALISFFGGGNGSVQLTLHFTSTTDLETNTIKGKTLGAYISTGSVTPQSLPEPSSLALLGTGLLSLGGAIRYLRPKFLSR
jgi:hypothetical protein